MDNGDRINAIVINFSKAFDLVPHVDSRIVAWVREFLRGCTQRIKVGGELSEEVRVTLVCRKRAY
jgi:hypothetical protein